MILCFTTIFTLFMYNQSSNFYIHVPDYIVKAVALYDQIDNINKLNLVLHSDNIEKEFIPRIGDFIHNYNGKLVLSSYESLNYEAEIYTLTHNKAILAKEYKFVPNRVIVSKTGKLVEQITDTKLLENIDKIIDHKKYKNIVLGDFIWWNNNEYHIISDKNLSKKHLFNNLFSSEIDISVLTNMIDEYY